jgi:hypothetical protein
MFYNNNGDGTITVNCAVQPNTDVSGIGVRCAFYLQAAFSIFLNAGESSAKDLFATNLALIVTSISIVAGAYLDSSIDIVHAIMASHLAIMLLACATPIYAFPPRALKSKGMGKVIFLSTLTNFVSYPLLLSYNLVLWTRVRNIQSNKLCSSDGAGGWLFFGVANEVAESTENTDLIFKFVVCNTVWEASRILAEGARTLLWCKEARNRDDLLRDIRVHPVVWWMVKIIPTGRLWVQGVHGRLYRVFTTCLGLGTFIYVLATIERMIWVNGIETWVSQWTFGQIVAMMTLLVTFLFFLKRIQTYTQMLSLARSVDAANVRKSPVHRQIFRTCRHCGRRLGDCC